MQSPFSFRRFAPAFDYLGSPFSAFFRPLLLGFPVNTFVFSFLFLPLDLHFLSSAFVLLLVTQHPVLLFSFLPGSPHSGSPVHIGFFRPLCFPLPSYLISHAFLPVLLTQHSCIVSFRPSQLRSRSRSAGAHLSLSLKMFLHGFCFLSSTSALGFQLLSFCFFISSFPLFLPRSRPSSVSQFRFRFPVFPLPSCLVSHAFRPILSTLLSVCFLSSFPVSLPQLFHRCFPFRSLLRDRYLTSTFFRPFPF